MFTNAAELRDLTMFSGLPPNLRNSINDQVFNLIANSPTSGENRGQTPKSFHDEFAGRFDFRRR